MGDIIKPPAVRPGDRVGIIAPASKIHPELLTAGIATLEQMGYIPEWHPNILESDLYFAGTHERRAHELNGMFERDDIKAVLCARGGYGANYLLPHLDINCIKTHPKVFAGYSDVTCLLTYLNDATGLVTFHGPMVAKDFAVEEGVDECSWTNALGGTGSWEITNITPLIPGEAEGVLYGGCLSIVVASLGTPYEALTEGKMLFLEDVAAKPYQIDRMLMQLKMAGKLDAVKGIVFGEMLDCVQSANQLYTLQEVILRVVGELGIPVAFGLASGHVSKANITLPFGVRVRLSVSNENARLEIIETAAMIKE